MSRKERSSKKISMSPINEFGSNPFTSLDGSGLPEALPEPKHEIKVSVKEEESKLGNGERLEIRREKTGRGGKTVTTIRGIPPGLGKEKKEKPLYVTMCGILLPCFAFEIASVSFFALLDVKIDTRKTPAGCNFAISL